MLEVIPVYIRQHESVDKSTGKTYIHHSLVETHRDENGSPKQTTVMNLGKLALPKKQWHELALVLESMINKQIVMDGAYSSTIMDLAKECMKSYKVYPQVTVPSVHSKEKPPRNVDMREIKARTQRTLGPELVCQWAWDKLQISSILKKANFTQKDIGMARAAVFGRMIYPGSERRTFAWAQNRSSLFEFPNFDVSRYGIDQFYNISDMLYNAKKTIEDELYSIENKLFPPSDNVVFHYDLTNTYFEGRALRNTYGKHGKSKEKRTDCPLMSLSLAVRNDGFPVYSCIYPGNQPEPITLKDMIKNVEALIAGPNAYDNQKTMFRPTFIMDRGIATKENVALLQYEKFNYVVVKREDETKNYKDLFKNGRKTFDVVSEGHVSAYGDLNKVYVKKLEPVNNERFCKVLCISDGKAQKQIAIITKKDSKLIKDFEDLNQAIKKGRIKNIDKIQARIGRIKARHKKSSEKYEVSLVIENEKALYVTWAKKPYYSCDESIYGRYVIETTFTKLDAIQIWILYMKQTIVERTFRTMKHDLHIRPVFHQTKDRSSAHIFVTLLAYHLVITILNTLSEQGDKRSWATLRDILFTHCRVSLFHEDKVKGKAVNIRKSGVPEEEHLEIYKKLGITDYLKDVETVEYLD